MKKAIYENDSILTRELHKTPEIDIKEVVTEMVHELNRVAFMKRCDLLLPRADSQLTSMVDTIIAEILKRPWWEGKVLATGEVTVPTFRDSFGNHMLEFTGAYTT